MGFNPFNPTEVGDPKDIGPVVLSMFGGFNPRHRSMCFANFVPLSLCHVHVRTDNTTTYETGETVVCDGNKTAKAELFYAQLNSIKPGGVSGYQYQPGPEAMRDAKGVPMAQ